MSKEQKPKTTDGYGLFRPDGTLKEVFKGAEMDDDREAFILAEAWDEIKPDSYHAAGTPLPQAVSDARKKGYYVRAVKIVPTDA